MLFINWNAHVVKNTMLENQNGRFTLDYWHRIKSMDQNNLIWVEQDFRTNGYDFNKKMQN